MKRAAAIFFFSLTAFAHRLDEYLQATTISLEKDRVQAELRLTPGVAIFPTIFGAIDANADGILSEAEQRAYAERVLSDLSLRLDRVPLRPRLTSVKFPEIQKMKDGLGEIQIDFDADLPHAAANRTLFFENHHRSESAAYLVNTLVPSDPDIRLIAQRRNYSQSSYELDYAQSGVRTGPLTVWEWSWLAAAALVWSMRLMLLRRRKSAKGGLQFARGFSDAPRSRS